MANLIRRNNTGHLTDYFDPFREMEEFEKRFFGRGFDRFMTDHDVMALRTDITDEGDRYVLEADLPGFAKESIALDLNGDILTIRAERSSKNESKDDENRVIRCERSYGSYERQFDVSGIDLDGIKSRYENGVLTLTLPKKEQAAPETRHLEIE